VNDSRKRTAAVRAVWLCLLSLCLLSLCLLSLCLLFLAPSAMAEDAPASTADGAVTELYRLVTFDAGTTPDWDRVRALFLDEAVVVLRTSREATTVFSADGFVDDFVKFAGREDVQASGFVERIVRRKSMVFGDMAHVLVLYEAEIPGTDRPPQQGVDSFELIRKDGRWWIAAILNEIPTPERPVPRELQE